MSETCPHCDVVSVTLSRCGYEKFSIGLPTSEFTNWAYPAQSFQIDGHVASKFNDVCGLGPARYYASQMLVSAIAAILL